MKTGTTAEKPITTAEQVARTLNVSRETLRQLENYVEMLGRWQRSINLVSRHSLDDVWRRHILDSGQLAQFLPSRPCRIMDIGSGAGLPGIVLAIMGAEAGHHCILVESDQRKAAFLTQAAHHCGVKPEIRAERIENIEFCNTDFLTARALAPVDQLLKLSRTQHHAGLACLFLKGKQLNKELTCLADYPTVEWRVHDSASDADGQILELRGFPEKYE